MGFFKNIFGKPDDDAAAPFMEHPTGDFENAIDAMADAIKRLRQLKNSSSPIIFSAQGQGSEGLEDLAFFDIRYTPDTLEVDEGPINILKLCQLSGVNPDQVIAKDNQINIAKLPPIEAARLMDTIYRHHFQLQPFPDENDDYAVGAEWEDEAI